MLVKYTAAARRDVAEIVRYYTFEVNGPSAADSFLASLRRSYRLLEAMPQAGRPRDDLGSGLRSIVPKGSPHIVYYQLIPDGLLIVRVLHQRRDERSEFDRTG